MFNQIYTKVIPLAVRSFFQFLIKKNILTLKEIETYITNYSINEMALGVVELDLDDNFFGFDEAKFYYIFEWIPYIFKHKIPQFSKTGKRHLKIIVRLLRIVKTGFKPNLSKSELDRLAILCESLVKLIVKTNCMEFTLNKRLKLSRNFQITKELHHLLHLSDLLNDAGPVTNIIKNEFWCPEIYQNILNAPKHDEPNVLSFLFETYLNFWKLNLAKLTNMFDILTGPLKFYFQDNFMLSTSFTTKSDDIIFFQETSYLNFFMFFKTGSFYTISNLDLSYDSALFFKIEKLLIGVFANGTKEYIIRSQHVKTNYCKKLNSHKILNITNQLESVNIINLLQNKYFRMCSVKKLNKTNSIFLISNLDN